jgi:general secretion pathway protein D
MVFIRPTILRSSQDSRELAERRYGYVRAQQLQQKPGEEPSIDELVREYMGATPPVAPPQIIVPQVKSSSEVIHLPERPEKKK